MRIEHFLLPAPLNLLPRWARVFVQMCVLVLLIILFIGAFKTVWDVTLALPIQNLVATLFMIDMTCLVVFVIWADRLRTRRGQRVSRGLCPDCGYDLRASKHRCPECGRERGSRAK